MLTILYKNFCEMLLNDEAKTPIKECLTLLSQLDEEGRFPDVNYMDKQHSSWHVQIHFRRMVRLLSNCQVLENPDLRNQAMKGFDFWLHAGFENPNWWHNEIGQPQSMGKAALLLKPWLTKEQMELVLNIMKRGSLYTRPELYCVWEGANLLWGVFNTLQHAILADNPDIAVEAIAKATKELDFAYFDHDGIKPDYTFFQHNTLLYSGGYGRSFVEEFARILFILRGTPLQLSQESLERFSNYLLEGQQWMMLGESWDFNVVGREIARPEGISDCRYAEVFPLLEKIEELPRRQELLAFFSRTRTLSPQLNGDKIYPYGRLYISRRNGRYISTRVTDPRQALGETINAENHYSLNLYGGGITCQMSDPTAYDHVPPVWHPCYMPGATARLESDASLMKKRDLWSGRFATNQYGRVQILSKTDGCTFQDIHFNGITGVLARFFVDGAMIALGANICCEEEEPVVTALEQCRIRKESVKFTLPRGQGIYADGFLYAILDGALLCCHEEIKTGTWQRINEACIEPPETIPVRTLWIEHGIKPQQASYAYAIIPEDEKEALATLKKIELLCNTEEIQAIRVKNRVLAVFHKEGTLVLPNGKCVTGESVSAKVIEL